MPLTIEHNFHARSAQAGNACNAAPAAVLDAFVILADDSHLSGWYNRLTIKFEHDALVIDGQLPSYYLKQLVQERLRVIGPEIVNRIKVFPR